MFLDKKNIVTFVNKSHLIWTWYTNSYGCISPVPKDLFANTYLHCILVLSQVPTAIEEVLEEEAALEAAKENAKKVHQKQEDVCSGKTCTANEHCCEGQVCVDTDESKLLHLMALLS